MDERATALVAKIARVQELAEALLRYGNAKPDDIVAFADGTSGRLRTLLEEGRAALGDVAGLFDVAVPPSAPEVHDGR